MTIYAADSVRGQLPPHRPGAGRRLLAQRLGRDLPDLDEERKAELLAAADEAMEAARRYYGQQAAGV